MATMNIENEPRYVLRLSETERKYIRALLQNYLGQGSEPSDECKIREHLFISLSIPGEPT